MEEAARRYARRVLILHLLGLVVVIGIVLLAAREAYNRAYNQAVEQTIVRQELLAIQTAGAISNYYEDIMNDLTLVRKAVQVGEGMATPFGFAETLWPQFENRVSELIYIEVGDLGTLRAVPQQDIDLARQFVTTQMDWLDQLSAPDVSRPMKAEQGVVNLVAVPVGANGRLVAVVPLRMVQARFMAQVNINETMSANLMDEKGVITIGSDHQLVGFNLASSASAAEVRDVVREYFEKPRVMSMIYRQGVTINESFFSPRVVSAAPVKIGPTNWTVLIASHLSQLDQVLGNAFRAVVLWGAFVIVAITGILVSTAIQMIRGRIRMERITHEMLERELNQARDIQMAWLPQESKPAPTIDVAAINEPANHISGDFYNWFELPDGRMMVMIGDVTGHGMPAAFLMATTQMLTRSNMRQLNDPAKCLNEINFQMCEQVFSGQFVTMLICVIDLKKRELQLSIAGHYPPIVGDKTGYREIPAEPQIVLGVDSSAEYVTQVFPLTDDETTVVLYTDGVLDVIDPAGERFHAEGLWKVLHGQKNLDPQNTIDATLKAVNDFRGPRELKDDLTMVVMRIRHPAKG